MSPRQVQPVLAAIRARPLLTRKADGGRIDDRQQLGEVLAHEPVEQHRVRLLQRAQEDVTRKVAMCCVELRTHPQELRLEVLHHWRQQPIEAEAIALRSRERCAFVAIAVGEKCENPRASDPQPCGACGTGQAPITLRPGRQPSSAKNTRIPADESGLSQSR